MSRLRPFHVAAQERTGLLMFVGIDTVRGLGFGRRKSLFSLVVPRKQTVSSYLSMQTAESFSVTFICFLFPVWWQMRKEENHVLSLCLPTKLQ